MELSFFVKLLCQLTKTSDLLTPNAPRNYWDHVLAMLVFISSNLKKSGYSTKRAFSNA